MTLARAALLPQTARESREHEQDRERPKRATPPPHPLHTLQRRAGNRAVAELVQRRLSGIDDGISARVVDRALADRSPGRPLDGGARERMEASFGRSFTDVRVHADSDAGALARGLHADAFTRGKDIYFGNGAYDPGSVAGGRLLAHELTHAVQQENTPASASGLSAANDPAEREADAIADRVTGGGPAPPPREAPVALARQEPEPVPVPTPTPTPTETAAPLDPDPVADEAVAKIIGLLAGYTSDADSKAIVDEFKKHDRPTVRSIMRRLRAKGAARGETPEGMVEWLLGDLTPSDRQQVRILLARAQSDEPVAQPGKAPEAEKVDKEVVSAAVDTIMEALIGPTGTWGSGRILKAFQEKSPATIRAILAELKTVAPADMEPEQMIDWLFSDMIKEDRRELRSLLFGVAAQEDLVRIAAKEVDNVLTGYTSEADSREIIGTLTLFPSAGLDAVLQQLELLRPAEKGESTEDAVAYQLFADMTDAEAEELRQHFFAMGGKASIYAAIYTSRKVKSLLDGYTGYADSSSILDNFKTIAEPEYRQQVQAELEGLTAPKTSEQALMENMYEHHYAQLAALPGMKLSAFVPQHGVAAEIGIGFFDALSDVVEVVVGLVIGIVTGIAAFILGLIGLVIDIVLAAVYLVMSAVYFITLGTVGGSFWLATKEFFKGLGQLLAHPIDTLSAAWAQTVRESEAIEGTFEYGRRTEFWTRRIITFVLNVYFFIRGAAAAAKGTAGFAAEARKVGLTAAFVKTGEKALASGSKIVGQVGEVAAALLTKLRTPIQSLRALGPRISNLLSATTRQQVWKFLRATPGQLKEGELEFWKNQKDFWNERVRGSQKKHIELSDKSGEIEERLNTDQPKPEDSQAIDDVADDANKLDESVGKQEEDILGKKQEGEPAAEPTVRKLPPLRVPGSVLATGANEAEVMEAYLQAAAQAAPEGVEVGIYVRDTATGKEFAVVQGYKGGVRAPAGEGWFNTSHFHPDAPSDPGFHNPAPQDLTGALDDLRRKPDWSGGVKQKVHSRTPTGDLHEVEFGIDPAHADKPYFVRPPGQAEPIRFPELWPDSIAPEVNAINAIKDPAERLRRLLEVFRRLDPDRYYAGWWARRFSLGGVPSAGGAGGGFTPPPTGGGGGGGSIPPVGGGGGGGAAARSDLPPVLLWTEPNQPSLVSGGKVLPWPGRTTMTGEPRLFGAGGEPLFGPRTPPPPLLDVHGRPLPLTPRTGPLIVDLQSGAGTFLPEHVAGVPGARGVGLETGDWLLGYQRFTTTDPQELALMRQYVAEAPLWPDTPAWRTPIERVPALHPWELHPRPYLWPQTGPVTTLREPFFPALGGGPEGGERLIPRNLQDVSRVLPTQHPQLYGLADQIYLRRPFGLSRASEETIAELGRELNRMLRPDGFVEFRVRVPRDLLVPEPGRPSVDQLAAIANEIEGAEVVTVDRAAIKAFAERGVVPSDAVQASILQNAAPDIERGGLGEGLFTLIARIYKRAPAP